MDALAEYRAANLRADLLLILSEIARARSETAHGFPDVADRILELASDRLSGVIASGAIADFVATMKEAA